MCKWCDKYTEMCVNAESEHCGDICPYSMPFFCTHSEEDFREIGG